ncbi:MAG: serpin family protein [Candidatus Eisenbacteria sp.]|nr:serpin family protein [Candidatus Eisenbacteria bacterium]
MRMPQTALVMLFVSALLLGCSDDKTTNPDPDIRTVRQIPEEFQDDVVLLVEGNNEFALKLYDELSSQNGNMFFSPFSISTALAMIWAGARTQTEEEIAQVLHFPFDQEQLHPIFGALQQSLDTGIGYDLYQLKIANRLWGCTGYPWLEPFLEITRSDYGAELEQLDFSANPEAARLRINQWVSEKTAGRIPDILAPGLLDPLTRLVLANAIYFKGDWVSCFDRKRTEIEPFWTTPDASVDVAMMQQTERFPLCTVPSMSILELPYVGQDLSMVILLPEQVDGLCALEAELTLQKLTSWIDALHEQEVDVKLPRFTFSSKFNLVDHMSAMGMPSAFNPLAADLSGMATMEELYLSFLVHEAFVLVNEEGTEAAAATAGGVAGTSAPAVFVADHPFIFLIRDRVTGSILFMGRMIDPSASPDVKASL